MRNIFLALLMLPAITNSQTIKISAGATASTIILPAVTQIQTGPKNVLIGSIASIGVDYSETNWGFLSSKLALFKRAE